MLQKEQSTNGRPAVTHTTIPIAQSHPFHQGCPYFALPGDPDTSLLFASSMGHCHRATPPAPVLIGHQESRCLTARHKGCPIYLKPGPLPSSLQGPDVAAPQIGQVWGKLPWAITAIVLIAALATAWISGLLNFTSSTNGDGESNQPFAVVERPAQTAAATPPTAAATIPVMQPGNETAVDPSSQPPATQAPTKAPTGAPPATITPIPTMARPPTFTPVPPPPVAIISAAPVNLRAGPDLSYPILQTLQETGARYDIVGRLVTGEWWQICCIDGNPAWVIAESVDLWGIISSVPLVDIPTAPEP